MADPKDGRTPSLTAVPMPNPWLNPALAKPHPEILVGMNPQKGFTQVSVLPSSSRRVHVPKAFGTVDVDEDLKALYATEASEVSANDNPIMAILKILWDLLVRFFNAVIDFFKALFSKTTPEQASPESEFDTIWYMSSSPEKPQRKSDEFDDDDYGPDPARRSAAFGRSSPIHSQSGQNGASTNGQTTSTHSSPTRVGSVR